jgi:DNA polymerase III delta subunit
MKSVLILHGDHDFLRHQFYVKFRQKLFESGFTSFFEVDAKENPDSLREFLIPSPFMVDKKMVLVKNPETLDVSYLAEIQDLEDPETLVLLNFTRKIPKNWKVGKWIKSLKNSQKREFFLPAPYKMEETARKHLKEWVESEGFEIKPALITAWVSRVGFDVGRLNFEWFKVKTFLQAEGRTKVEPVDVMLFLSPSQDQAFVQFVEALSTRNVKKVDRILRQVSKTSMIPLCRFLSRTLIEWSAVVLGQEEGLSTSAMAERLGMNDFVLKMRFSSVLKNFSYDEIKYLTRVFSHTERLSFENVISPFDFLHTHLLYLLK